MSCYHPLCGVPVGASDGEGRYSYKILGKYDSLSKKNDPRAIAIPCGHCIGCRLDQSRQWADRMMLELQHTGKAVFLTMTYDNDHVPLSTDEDTGEFFWFNLNKRDLQLFFKRLRKRFSDKEIRYYAAGEYGSNTFRPHYHAVVFGLGLEDFPDRTLRGKNELGQCHFSSDLLADIWNAGFCLLAAVSWQTCAYVARYVQKKVFHGYSITDALGCDPEFSLSSRRPGLGKFYLDDHPELFDTSKIYVSGVPDGMLIPKYFLRKLRERPHWNEKGDKFIENPLYDPEKYDKLISERRQFSDDRMLLKLLQTDLSYEELLEKEENAKFMKANCLNRGL